MHDYFSLNVSHKILSCIIFIIPVCFLLTTCISKYDYPEKNAELLEHIDKAIKFQKTNLDSSIHYSESAFKKAKEVSDLWAQGRAKAITARSQSKKGHFFDSYKNYLESLQALQNCDTLDFFTQYTVTRNMASINESFEEYDSCARYYSLALAYLSKHILQYPKIAAKYKDHERIEQLTFFKAKYSGESGNHQNATSVLQLLYENDTVDTELRVSSLNEIGLILNRQKEDSSAVLCFKKMLEIDGISDTGKAMAYHNISGYFFRQVSYDSAEFYLRKSLMIKENLGLKNRSHFLSLLDLGETLLNKAEFKESIEILEKALAFPKARDILNEDPELKKIYNYLSLSYEALFPGSGEVYMSSFLVFESDRQVENQRKMFTLEVESYFDDLKLKYEEQARRRLTTKIIVISALLTLVYVGFYIKKKEKHKKRRLFDDIFHEAKK